MDDDVCAHGDHRPPARGGSCPCGMVTRIPARTPPASADDAVRDLIARCLVERGGVADLAGLRQRADRVLGALAHAGLEIAHRPAADRAGERRSA
ncbi:hypothetical protein JKP75_03085 [Blastococcus sp. TML/M2B]|uniref:hypothetical protein n=1 Tax=unclassified Blastococcus TaxID=2619396 RepID=UPI00190DF9F0|nr:MULTISPECIES: hypothetical protein [unclassified Blastococcus]MBN1091645.1 hypothetical protein [Blastococcus sp. TML/M2B]MBN1094799.1 hypothetical protein [Blastococcus sp. TML/C7B]